MDDEAAVRSKLISDNRVLQANLEQLRDQLDEELHFKEELQRQLSKVASEASSWKQKFENGEGNIRPEEVEELKKKLAARFLSLTLIDILWITSIIAIKLTLLLLDRRNHVNRIQDSEAQLEAVVSKAVSLEKAKSRLVLENQTLQADLEKVVIIRKLKLNMNQIMRTLQ